MINFLIHKQSPICLLKCLFLQALNHALLLSFVHFNICTKCNTKWKNNIYLALYRYSVKCAFLQNTHTNNNLRFYKKMKKKIYQEKRYFANDDVLHKLLVCALEIVVISIFSFSFGNDLPLPQLIYLNNYLFHFFSTHSYIINCITKLYVPIVCNFYFFFSRFFNADH